MTISNIQTDLIKALGKIEGFKHDVRMLCDAIDRAPMWQPGTVLKKQCDEVLRMMDQLEARFERKLIVTIIGPCGSGKSTLLNALAQVDNLSKTGNRRPTTQDLVILSREITDADHLKEQLGVEHLDIRSSPAAGSLENVLLIDTPDTDSTQQEKHIHLVENAIAVSDILICMFDAENPKRRDHVDFLAHYVRLFTGDALVVVINKCDRQDKTELTRIIVPEFFQFIKSAWEKPIQKIFCISARQHLQNPDWDPSARPIHDFDEFADLKQMIFGTFNRSGYIIDRRIENAQSLRDYILQEASLEIQRNSKILKEAKQHVQEAEKNALNATLSAFKKGDSKRALGINALVYQKLAQRWLGPIGWLIALWARILIFGTGIASVFRFGNPVRQLAGMVSSLFNFKESKAFAAETEKLDKIDVAMRDFRLSVLQDWPDIAKSLVKAGFDTRVRKTEDMLSYNHTLNQDLSSLWSDALEHTMETASRKLSGLILQMLFNLPVIGILGHVGWITARDYFIGQYLSFDFFLHAFLTIAITLFLSFFVFQGCVRLTAGPERITQKAFEKMKQQVEQFQPISMNPVGEQIDMLLTLASIDPTAKQMGSKL